MLKKLLISGTCAFFSLNVCAFEDPYAPVLPQVWSSIITVSGGPAWSDPGKDQYLYPFPPPQNDYYIADSKSDWLGTGELFFGLQHFIGTTNIIAQFGLGVAAASDAALSGTVNVNGVPDVYTYQYKISHVRAEFKGKLISNCFPMLQPYLSGSFGVGWNHSHDWTPTTIDPVLYPTYWFTTSSVVAFSYTLGAGVQKMLTPHWQVGMGVEFADWGKSYLGGDGATLNQGPGMPHLYTTELL
ncbi:outer membrane protein, partial [Fluoribacter dumoffii]